MISDKSTSATLPLFVVHHPHALPTFDLVYPTIEHPTQQRQSCAHVIEGNDTEVARYKKIHIDSLNHGSYLTLRQRPHDVDGCLMNEMSLTQPLACLGDAAARHG